MPDLNLLLLEMSFSLTHKKIELGWTTITRFVLLECGSYKTN